jgi:hypothetical protein
VQNPSGTTNYVYGSYPNGAYMLINQEKPLPKGCQWQLIAGELLLGLKVELRYPLLPDVQPSHSAVVAFLCL